MRRETCSNCTAKAKVARGNYLFEESGLQVVLQGIEIIRCPKCGNEDPIIPRLEELTRVLALAVIHKPYGLRGEEVRFLRHYLRMNGTEFSQLLHIDRTTLSKWENNENPIGDQSDRLIRTIALGFGDGLKDELEKAIRGFPKIQPTNRMVNIRMNPQTLSYQYA